MNPTITGSPIDEAHVDGQVRPAGSRAAVEWARGAAPAASTADATSAARFGPPAESATPPPDRAGQLVAERYRILRLLGEGGMGSVWLALDCMLSRPVALKELTGPASDRGGHRTAALREARAASAVAHPGVVQVYDVLVDDDQSWIVMEALSGTTLAQALRRDGPIPAEQVVAIGLDLLEALKAIHKRGVIHGDLKPGNIMLTGTGRPVITDFGLSSIGDDPADREPSLVVGSPPYMSPETIRTGTKAPASDLFALGATLYEAAEGRRPFVDDSLEATLLSVLHHDPEPALGGTRLGVIIDGLLTKDPRHRLTAHEADALLKEAESEAAWSGDGAGTAETRPRRPVSVEAA